MKKYINLNQAFVEELVALSSRGKEVKSRGFSQKERLFVSMEIDNPTVLGIDVPARKFSLNYGILEWLWYTQADSNIKNIGKFADIWNKIADTSNEVESNYGVYLKEQWSWTINEILEDPDTRRATIVINQPYHKYKNEKDYPCTHYIHFFVRDEKLHLGVNMRSNDAVFGFCNDVFTFALFQQLMLNELNSRGMNITLGSYYHYAGSFHIYDRHYPMMNKICTNYYLTALRAGYPTELEKLILKSNLTFPDVVELGNFLTEDLTFEEIKDKITAVKKELFE